MNARDYQHKRFRNKKNPTSSIDATPPRVVTPSSAGAGYGPPGTGNSQQVLIQGQSINDSGMNVMIPRNINFEGNDISSGRASNQMMDDYDSSLSGHESSNFFQASVTSTTSSAADYPTKPMSAQSLLSNQEDSSSKDVDDAWMPPAIQKVTTSSVAASHSSSKYASPEKPPSSSTLTSSASPFVHKPTAGGGVKSQSSPFRPTEPARYSLSKGTEAATTTSTPPVSTIDGSFLPRRAGDGMAPVAGNGTPSSLKAAHGLALQKKRASDTQMAGLRAALRQDPTAYKIFLLLLQPSSKIFELIQVLYQPKDTTIGKLLQMIPDNATEQALGVQEYIGLCRPKTQDELLEMDLLASETLVGVKSANITLGEILVAIPKGYTGSEVATLSQQILGNPKIVKLLKRADPLAPKHRHRRKSSRRSSRNKGSGRSTSREQVHVMELHQEEDEATSEHQHHRTSKSGGTQDNQLSIQAMKKAMDKAAAEAAATNAAIPGFSNSLSNIGSRNNLSCSERSLDIQSTQSSLDDSYASWSKSFDASFATTTGSVCSGVSKRAHRRRERHVKRSRILHQSAIGTMLVMIVWYLMDPQRSTGTTYEDETAWVETHHRRPMGWAGIFQCLFLLLSLCEVEHLLRKRPNTSVDGSATGATGSTSLWSPFLQASAKGMRQFKARYAKKLQRKTKTAPAVDDDVVSVSQQRLKNFSLKANHTATMNVAS